LDDASPEGRQALVNAIFSQLDVLGFRQLEYSLSEDARTSVWAPRCQRSWELGSKIAEFGRGERHSPAITDLPITMRLAEPPEPFDWLRSA
jgi:hypothetical protein